MFENLTKKKCRYFLTALFAAVGISYVAVAETANGNAETLQCDVCGLDQLTAPIDLEGASVTVDDISADRQYVNSSETPAVLVFDTDDDVAFGGSVHDNILIVKKGEGKIAFAKENSHTLGMIISNGTVSVSAENQLGPGTLTFAGGTLDVAQSFTQTEVIFDFTGDVGTINVAEGAVLTISNQFFKTAGGVFVKKGEGTIAVSTAFTKVNPCDKARWIVSDGCLRIEKGSTWGGHDTAADFTLEVHETGVVRADDAHVPLPNVVMRGGLLYHPRTVVNSSGSYRTFPNYSFRQQLTVLPSSRPSRVLADMCYATHGSLKPVFNISQGAVLRMDCILEGGFDAAGEARIGGGFVKRGKGELVLMHACDFDGGSVKVEEGSLKIERGASISKETDLTVWKNARVELADGAVLDCPVKGAAAEEVLADADVWLDATSYDAGGKDNMRVESVANKGKAGGNFGKITETQPDGASLIPDMPVWIASGINNSPAFYFDGKSMMALKSYENSGSALTVFAVMMYNKYVRYNGYISMKDATHSGTDGTKEAGFFRIEQNKTTYSYARAGKTLSLEHTAENLIPYYDFYETTESFRRASRCRYDGTAISGENTDSVSAKFAVNIVGVGGRLGTYGTAQYYGGTGGSNRMFDGYVGELLIWSRVLTEAEKAKVIAYIKSKWFGVSGIAEETASAGQVTVNVAEGTGGVAQPAAGSLVKNGSGNLLVGNACGVEKVHIAEGALTLAPTVLVHKAAVWMDASDASALTVADGKVTAVRNKGYSGGVFVRNLRGGDVSPGVPALGYDINGLSTLAFDGNSALALESYINKKDDRRIRIYMVGRRSAESDLTVNRKGRYGSAFSMTSVEEDNTDQNHTAFMVAEEQTKDGSTSMTLRVGKNHQAKSQSLAMKCDFYNKEEPFVFTAQIGVSSFSFGLEMEDGDAAYENSDDGKLDIGSPSMNIDIVQLGGRLGNFGKATWVGNSNTGNRMWLGSIGEFIVCDGQLTEVEHLAMLDYLREKWFDGGNADAAKPVVLGTAISPALAGDVNLSMAEGTKLESHVATLPLGSLKVEGSATFARGGVTDSANYAMFNVSGGMSLPSAMTFIPLCLPDSNYAKLLMGAAAQGAGATTWTIGDGSSTKWSASTSAEGVAISRAGMSIVIR